MNASRRLERRVLAALGQAAKAAEEPDGSARICYDFRQEFAKHRACPRVREFSRKRAVSISGDTAKDTANDTSDDFIYREDATCRG